MANYVAASGGLPPRARGSPCVPHAARRCRGPTPACAGITGTRSGRTSAHSAYPRVRGDHHVPLGCRLDQHGLPPRARGSRQSRVPVPDETGPTPACAGITSPARRHQTASGPTPACAGITSAWWPPLRRAAAYPRVRGDHEADVFWPSPDRGLPPRARGSQRHGPRGGARTWPTPACAGITAPSGALSTLNTAYPRVRGDHRDGGTGEHRLDGLPPRARGSPVQCVNPAGAQRPTPACAGITSVRVTSRGTNQAYPRVRGDHAILPAAALPANGLPPRARGSPCCAKRSRRRPRPTPACAGITGWG